MSYADFVTARESPDGRDNAAGSGAFSKYQFMPATAAALAHRTSWGQGLTPATVKAAVMADPARADELFKLYNADSTNALAKAGLPANNTSMLALHRFGQGGGTSLLQAPADMPVAQWVRSVNWGPGVAADAVIRQNALDRYANVGDLRKRFLGADEPGAPSIATAWQQASPAAEPQPQPQIPVGERRLPGMPSLADLFTLDEPPPFRDRHAAQQRSLASLF